MIFFGKKIDLTHCSDAELMHKIGKGNTAAFEVLYDRYNALIYRFFYRMLAQNTALSEDFTQDVFLKIIEKPELFDANRSFKTWIYSMATNANFIIGQRASVVFGDGTTTASGNPHVYARNAFAGVFSSYIMLKNRSILWKLFSLGNMIFSVVVLVLTQARSILLAFFFTMAIFLYYNISTKSIKSTFKNIFKPQNIFLIALLFSGVAYFISTQAKLVAIINLYYDTFSITFTKAILTATGMEDAKTIDYSSLGRVNTFGVFKKVFLEKPWELILGKGYRFLYMDIPILETWIDCGIIAFWSFAMMNLVLFRQALRAIKDGTNPLTTFLGYFYMCYFVTLFTGGEPYGIAYWFVFCVMIRFLGVKYLEKIPNILQRKEENTSPVMTS